MIFFQDHECIPIKSKVLTREMMLLLLYQAHAIVNNGAFTHTETSFTLLDIALLLNAHKCAQVLIANGARETRARE